MHSRLPSSVLSNIRKRTVYLTHMLEIYFFCCFNTKNPENIFHKHFRTGITFYRNSFPTYYKTLKVNGLGCSYILHVIKCYLFSLRFTHHILMISFVHLTRSKVMC